MTHYILQTIAFQVVFLLFYDLFFKKATFFNWNRFYLLSTPIMSIVLPLIKINAIQNSIPQEFIIQLPVVFMKETNLDSGIIGFGSITNSMVIWQLWILGLLISLMVFSYKYYQLTKLKKNGTHMFIGGVLVILLKNTDTAFSFYKTIYLGDALSKSQQATIILHEKTHINHYHTIDLLLFEAFRIIFWFNPLVYIYQKRMVILQEYIADARVTFHKNKKEYYQELLSQVFKTNKISFINPFFNHSLIRLTVFGKEFILGKPFGQIKKRIIMLQKSKSKKTGLFMYLLIVPLVSLMLIYTSCAQETEKNTTKTEVTNLKNSQDTSNEKVSFAMIDKVPTYPDCSGDNEALKNCMFKKIWEYVGKEFNTEVSKGTNINGRQRILVNFKIDKTGSVIGVKAKANHAVLEEEAIRVVSSLPQMLPGEHKGKVVSVKYSLPIVFELKE